MKTNQTKPNRLQTASIAARERKEHIEPRHMFVSLRSLSSFAANLLLFLLPAAVQAEDYIYTTNNGTITITGYTGPVGDVTIPDTINGFPVTSIGTEAFDSCGLTSVTIPDSVLTIEDGSTGSFGGPWGAFSRCPSLSSVTIGNSLTYIGHYAFYSCTSLTNITIPNSVINIGDGAFSYCSSLTAITVDALNFFYSSTDGVLFNKNQTTLIQCPGAKSGNYTIPTSVTSIRYGAFAGCASLANITIPASVTTIGNQSFAGCTSLASVTIPTNVTSIGNGSFYNCLSLTSVTIPNSVTGIGDAAFSSCTSLTNITIPNSVINIGDEAFYSCTSLSSVTIPNGVTSIGFAAFAKSGLTRVTIPNTIISIGGGAEVGRGGFVGAFSHCTSLTNAKIGNGVTNIGHFAFFYCISLTNVMIGNRVTNIGSWAFRSCSNLTGVYFQGNAPGASSDVFYTATTNTTVYYLPGTTGWEPTFGDRPTALWVLPYPLILNNNSPSFGVQTNGFGFIISWATNISVVVEASPDLANPVWAPVSTNTLTGGSSYFSDAEWTNHPARFYRLRSL